MVTFDLKVPIEVIIKLTEGVLWYLPWATRRRYIQAEYERCYFYELKAAHHNKGKEPPHFLCTHCFSNRKLRTLQSCNGGWHCLECQSVFQFNLSPNHGPISQVRIMR